MTEADDLTLSSIAEPATPSRLAARLARATLRTSIYPGRRLRGTFLRKKSRRHGGHRFGVTTPDGLELDAWYSPASPQGPAPDAPPRLPVVMLHGWLEVKECHFRRAWALNRLGHDVVLFDHRAHGRSAGQAATFGVRERHDLAAVIDQAERLGFLGDAGRVITHGFSMGAATALQHAPSDPRVAGVIALAPFSDFREAIRSFRIKFAPWMDDQWLLNGFHQATHDAGFTVQQASTLDAIRRLDVPVLLVEGACDSALPPATHTQQLAAAKILGDLQVVTIDGATHCGLIRKSWANLDQAIAGFCAKLR